MGAGRRRTDITVVIVPHTGPAGLDCLNEDDLGFACTVLHARFSFFSRRFVLFFLNQRSAHGRHRFLLVSWGW